MRFLLGIVALLLLGTFAPPGLHEPAPVPAKPLLFFEPVSVRPHDEGERRIGSLLYLGGWSVESNDPRFGGVSAIHVEAGHVLAVSDTGRVFRFRLSEGRGAVPLRIEPLEGGLEPSSRKAARDSEAMAVAGGSVWIAFENRNAVWRYPLGRWRGGSGTVPAAMARWPYNRGSEAMVRLTDGRFLLLAEGKRGHEGATAALLFAGDAAVPETRAEPLRYRPPQDYRITDAAQLPDGRLLFLNRRLSLLGGFTAKLTIGRLPEEGDLLSGEEIATFAPPFLADNFEALAVTREGGRDIIWIASDDNFSGLQRTLLLKFVLAD